MRTIRLILLALSLALLVSCGGNASQEKSAAEGEAQSGQEQFRFAVFSPAIGVMLRDLGYEDSIVGRHAYDAALSESIPVVGSHIEIDYEVLITRDPTHLIFERNSIELPDRLVELAEEEGWEIWRYELESLDDIAHSLDDLHFKIGGFPKPGAAPGARGELLGMEIDPERGLDAVLPSARLARAWSPVGAPAETAGRVLVLAGIDPAGAMGPGSFHAQLIERMGITPALRDGGMWQELDLEDMITLAPDSIIVLLPRARDDEPRIGEPEELSWDEIRGRLGAVAELPIPAVESRRIAIIEHPDALLPSTSLAQVADEIRKTLAAWHERVGSP